MEADVSSAARSMARIMEAMHAAGVPSEVSAVVLLKLMSAALDLGGASLEVKALIDGSATVKNDTPLGGFTVEMERDKNEYALIGSAFMEVIETLVTSDGKKKTTKGGDSATG